MSTDVSRVYQFLAKQGDWVSAADQNGDGAIVKAEFRDFMENSYEWDGETTEEGKNDLINTFWKSIDTKQAGNISGTKLKNKNALDSNEIAAMDKQIAMYEILNDFTSTLSAPSVVSDSANWKKSVSAGLASLVETYIKQGGTEEELLTYLEEQAPTIENKATADYCANEYLNSEMTTLVKEYGYAYADDSTLLGMIDSYIQNIPVDTDASEIRETVINIIDAYLATAGLKADNNYDLSQFGYSPNNSTGLNDLQKSVLKKTLETDLSSGELKEDYENNTELFATAIESYLSELKFTDFESVATDVVGSFKASDAYSGVQKNIQVQKLLVSEDFKNALTVNIGESIANTIVSDGKYLTVMKEIQTEALEKAQNGDFDVNGALDTQTALNWLVEQVSARLAEFYPNGFGDMSLGELNVMYDKLVESAEKQADTDKQLELLRDAAIQYCDALVEKSTKFAEIVKSAFGDSYAAEIGKLYPSDIQAKIEELKAEVLELGDANELVLSDSTWSNISNGNVIVSPGTNKSFIITPSFTDKNGVSKTITTDRIQYKSSNTSLINIDSSGNATVTGTANGTFSAKITVIVDGVEVGEKTINIKVVTSAVDWASMGNDNVNGFISMDGSDTTPNTVKSLAELYNGNGVMNLLAHNDMRRGLDWLGAVAEAKTAIGTFVDTIASACASSGIQYDQTALNTAKEKVVALYTAAFDHSIDNWAGKKETKNNTFQYDGQTYSYQVCKYYKNSTTMDTAYAQGCSASNNQLGLRIGEQYDDHWFQITVNTRCVMDLFNRFYQEALGL